MKKLILMIIPLTMTFALLAQDSQTKDTQKKQSSQQKSMTKSKSEPATVLDGKAYRISLTQKDEALNSTPATSGNTSTASETRDMKKSKDESANTSANAKTQPSAANSDQQTFQSNYDWNNGKGKLRFENGMLKLSMNNKEVAFDNCKYNVTSGTADLATFSAGCRLNNSSAMNDGSVQSPATQSGLNTGDIGTSPTEQKAKSSGNAGRAENNTIDNKPRDMNTAKTPVENNEINGNTDVATQNPKADDRTAGNQQPAARNMESANSNPATAQNSSTQNQQNSSQNKSASLNITGFVNGSSISGTIMLYENGKMTSYSFSGTSTSKRDAETLGLNEDK